MVQLVRLSYRGSDSVPNFKLTKRTLESMQDMFPGTNTCLLKTIVTKPRVEIDCILAVRLEWGNVRLLATLLTDKFFSSKTTVPTGST